MLWIYVLVGIAVIVFAAGVKIIRPTERGLIERLGKYKGFANSGFNWIIPLIDRMVEINITETMVDAQKQEIITKDRLNATVDAQVYFKVRADEPSVKNSQYNVNDYKYQIVNLARTTLRNIIGNMSYDSANSDRKAINNELKKILEVEAKPWGVEIVRTELKEIQPTSAVQISMNEVLMAENKKTAAINFATATETEADGQRRAAIKKAEGIRQANILEAEGQAQATILKANAQAEAIKQVSESSERYFVGNAQILKKLEVTQASLENNAKIVVPEGSELINVIGEMAGMPIPIKK